MAMENKRIIQLNTERTTPAADDYVMVDSATAGTAKYLLPKITDAINQENSDRASADTALQTAITNEATARTNADTTLQGNITAEATARAEADTAINGEITQLREELKYSEGIIGFINSKPLYVPSGSAHSSLIDQTACNVSQNDDLYIKVVTDNPSDHRSVSVAFFENGSSVFSLWLQTNADDYSYIKATANASLFGLYAGAISANATYTVCLAKGDRSVIVKTNMFTNSVNTMGALVMGQNKFVDYNTDTKKITIPNECILVDSGKRFAPFVLSAMTLTHSLNTTAIKLYVNPTNSTLIEAAYDDVTYAKDYTNVLIGTLRINGEKSSFYGAFPWSINGTPYGIQGITTAKLLLGYEKYVDLDIYTKTLTIPAETIVCLSNGTNITITQAQTVDFSGINTSAFKLFFDSSNNTFVPYYYADASAVASNSKFYLATIRLRGTSGVNTISAEFPWSVNGEPYGIGFASPAYVAECNGHAVSGINHRGYNTIAPENTLPAYKLSKRKGFAKVETDISFTRDGVAVLLHDNTINRTARNLDGTEIAETININDIDYADLADYDFGIWKGAQYAGTPIPTVEEFLQLCRGLGLHPVMELKNNGGATEARVQALVDLVKRNGMKGNVTWASFSSTVLGYVKNYDPSARLGYVVNTVDATAIADALALKTATNEVFIDAGDYSSTAVTLCYNAGLPLEVWTIDQPETILLLDPYISGVTSDSWVASQVIYDNMIK